MTTANAARSVIQARIEAGALVDTSNNPVALHWQDENVVVLPDTPTPFVYTELQLEERAKLTAYGGGRGNNLYRNYCCISAYVFVPNDHTLKEAESIAEQIAALFRSYRDTDISCFDASVIAGGKGELIKPPGVSSDVSNYLWAMASVSLFFDQVG